MATSDLATRRQAAARAFVREGLGKKRAWAEKSYAYDREDQMYLGWLDLDPKKTTEQKIGEAIAAYVAKFKTRPNVVLVNEADQGVEVQGVTIRKESYIRRNNFWIGWEHALS